MSPHATVADGHHFLNRSDKVAKFLVVGTKAPREVSTYSDVDLRVEIEAGKARFTYKDGSDWTGFAVFSYVIGQCVL